MSKRRYLILVFVAVFAATWAASCGSSESPAPPPVVGGAGGAGGTGVGGSAGGLNLGGNEPQECTTSADCDGGVCVNGICCATADQACGQSCCGDDEVCVFGECVTPGDPCLTNADCPDGHYCEPALGEQTDGGVIDAGPDAVCTAPQPAAGRCVPLPPICGPGEDPPGCIEPCEYHPPTGQLSAIREWQWGHDPAPSEYPSAADVWSTPAVARIYDANCDGEVNLADPPQIVFVSGDVMNTCCHCTGQSPSRCQDGVLRMLDGASGTEIWSLDRPEPGSRGFAGVSVAVGDIDGDESLDIIALSGEGNVVMIDAWGQVQHISDQPAATVGGDGFGWGGGISLGDMNHDGLVEIAFGRNLFEWTGSGINFMWTGGFGQGRANTLLTLSTAISYFVDLDNTGDLELLAGNTAYLRNGDTLWDSTDNGLADGLTAVGDVDENGTPEVVLVTGGQVMLLNGADGLPFDGWAPLGLTGNGHGGPPTVADFDGDGLPEIGVALQDFYSMVKPDLGNGQLTEVWAAPTHDFSSSVTGSSVFDFEGDGRAEVVYNDECFQWVYDGADGTVLLVSYTQSFTATESSIVADVDGDGHSELLIMANGSDTSSWHCAHHTQDQTPISPHTVPMPIWEPPAVGANYRGITVLGDAENAWVGTRTQWNQHAYSVSNICDPRDSACGAGSYYGQIPPDQLANWDVPWLNNFRQNVQDEGLFDAPDAVVSLTAECVMPVAMQVSVRNVGLSGLPAGIDVEVVKVDTPEVQLGIVSTTIPLLPGQTEVIPFVAPQGQATTSDTFLARIILPDPPTFHECRDNNNESPPTSPDCVQ